MVDKIHVKTTINGLPQEFLVDPFMSLLETLRDVLNLTGTKEGCNDGNCGACTVVLDGRIVDSCCVLGAEIEGKTVETIEGMAGPDGLHPLQQAFIDHDAVQCAFCTSGQLMAARALLSGNEQPNREEVRNALAGNLCRCGNYDRIVEAVLSAADGGGAR